MIEVILSVTILVLMGVAIENNRRHVKQIKDLREMVANAQSMTRQSLTVDPVAASVKEHQELRQIIKKVNQRSNRLVN